MPKPFKYLEGIASNPLDMALKTDEAPQDHLPWATVTQMVPLRVRLDGETTPIGTTPIDLGGGGTRYIGERVFLMWLGDSTTTSRGRQLVILGPPAGGGIPTGASLEYSGLALPGGFLWEDGASYLRSDYPALFAALGGVNSPHGLPDADHFNVPNHIGRTGIGAGAIPGTATSATLGATGGEAEHTLTKNEMPVHNHGGETDDGYGWPYGAGIYTAGGSVHFVPIAYGGAYVGMDSTYQSRTKHRHPLLSDGGGWAHNNMQPWIAKRWMIKT